MVHFSPGLLVSFHRPNPTILQGQTPVPNSPSHPHVSCPAHPLQPFLTCQTHWTGGLDGPSHTWVVLKLFLGLQILGGHPSHMNVPSNHTATSSFSSGVTGGIPSNSIPLTVVLTSGTQEFRVEPPSGCPASLHLLGGYFSRASRVIHPPNPTILQGQTPYPTGHFTPYHGPHELSL